MSCRVLIRCDAAPAIGFGHVVRCLALADVLCNRYACQVAFAMLKGPEGVAHVRAQGYLVHQPPPAPATVVEGDWLRQLIIDNRACVLVLDVRSELAPAALRTLRESGILIVTIDDPSERRLLADLAFYPPVPQVERLDWTGFTGQRFVGWDWVILRPQFAGAARKARTAGVTPTTETAMLHRPLTLLVTMGGSDPAGLTLMALEAIDQLAGDFRTLLVLGQAFMHEAALADWLASARRSYELCRDVQDMAALMAETDLAVASFGVTAYELAAMGVPALYFCLTDDHAQSAQSLSAAGMAITLGNYRNLKPTDMMANLEAFFADPERQCALSEQCVLNVDGQGADRIAQQILQLHSARF